MIHWFPGHMHKATKELEKLMPKIDIAIEVVDARAPEATANPILHEVAKDKPIIKILSKQDLADPETTKAWLNFYQGKSLSLDIPNDKKNAAKIVALCRKQLPKRGTMIKPIRAVIFGIPNVGKSTLINTLAKRKIAKTGNEPAVTKRQQRIEIEKYFYLNDTPGIMFPSPKDEGCGYKLASIGSIRDTAMDYPSTAYFLLEYLQQVYPSLLAKRFKVDPNITDIEQLFHDIQKTMGQTNEHHISEKIVLAFRQGRAGRISLETPESYLNHQTTAKEIEDDGWLSS